MLCASTYWNLLIFCMTLLMGAITCAHPASAEAAVQTQSGDEEAPNYNGQDFTRPENNISTRFQYRSSGTTNQTDRERIMLQGNSKFDIGAGWKLGLLVQVPYIFKSTQASDPANSSHEAGLGDTTAQVSLLHAIDSTWAFGVGARFVAPAPRSALGSATWQVEPGVGIRYSFLEINSDTYFVPVIRYATSVNAIAGARNVSQPQIAPTLNIGLPDRWFVTFYPSNDIRINWGTPVSGQKGPLFLPFDIAAGRKFGDDVVASLEMSVPIVNDYPVYKFKTELKLTWQY